MTDKVQKIRKEVERQMTELIQEKKNGFGSDIDDACILELQNVLTYIDSLQEEHVNRTTADVESAMQEVEEKSMAFTEAHQGENTDTILAQMRGEEPVNNDLEEAASLYVADDALKPWQTMVKEAFKGGAKWKKKKMMKDAVKTEVCERITQNGLLPSVTVLVNEFKPGDKVKLIIIKDELL